MESDGWGEDADDHDVVIRNGVVFWLAPSGQWRESTVSTYQTTSFSSVPEGDIWVTLTRSPSESFSDNYLSQAGFWSFTHVLFS